MNAQRLPELQPVHKRPTYDNEHLGYESDWISANLADLVDWWDTCGGAAITPQNEFRSFCAAQHDIELAKRDGFKQTLRQYE